MPLNTENRRRAAGCHLCLTVPALPNVGLAAPDRPPLAWVYPEQYEQGHDSDLVLVIEALLATGEIMESLAGMILVEESLAAGPVVQETFAASPSLAEALAAVPGVQESLTATVVIVVS